MKNVRIWYRKEGPAKYMSHLDLVRVMGRVFHRAHIPLWYTEGFNPHPFMTFALPLSLGTAGLRESMDIRLMEELSGEEIVRRMNPCLPEGLKVLEAADPVMKPGAIAFGKYRLHISCEDVSPEQLLTALEGQLAKKELVIEKPSKKGPKLFDLKPAVQQAVFSAEPDGVLLEVVLPAGSTLNVNPSLLMDAFALYTRLPLESEILRTGILTAEMETFC